MDAFKNKVFFFHIYAWAVSIFCFQKFRVDLFSRMEEFQKFRGEKFSRIGKKTAKSAKTNLREN